MEKTHNTTLKRISSNIAQLGALLATDLSSAELHAVSVQLEGYSLIVKGYAMKAEEEK